MKLSDEYLSARFPEKNGFYIIKKDSIRVGRWESTPNTFNVEFYGSPHPFISADPDVWVYTQLSISTKEELEFLIKIASNEL